MIHIPEINLSVELQYIMVIFGMFIVSRILQRFNIPSAITCLGLGVLFGLGLGIFQDKPTVDVFAVLGIVSMFLFAGMEIDFGELRQAGKFIVQHLVIQVISIGLATYLASSFLKLQIRPSLLVALAIMTPSTGFILDALPCLPVDEGERFWIKSKAISTEIVALIILLFALQSSSPIKLTISLAVLGAMIFILPMAFRVFAESILPYAPKTEFAFLLIVALICASITKKLGVYYLVGAFIVGIVQQRVRVKLPSLAPENIIYAVEFFACFFIPFYFFKAGLKLTPQNFSREALALGVLFFLLAVPLRVFSVSSHHQLVLKAPLEKGVKLGIALLPTLVFTLVIAEILRDSFGASPALVGGLVVFTLLNSMMSGMVLRIFDSGQRSQ